MLLSSVRRSSLPTLGEGVGVRAAPTGTGDTPAHLIAAPLPLPERGEQVGREDVDEGDQQQEVTQGEDDQ